MKGPGLTRGPEVVYRCDHCGAERGAAIDAQCPGILEKIVSDEIDVEMEAYTARHPDLKWNDEAHARVWMYMYDRKMKERSHMIDAPHKWTPGRSDVYVPGPKFRL